jgi:predicted ester cyclase
VATRSAQVARREAKPDEKRFAALRLIERPPTSPGGLRVPLWCTGVLTTQWEAFDRRVPRGTAQNLTGYWDLYHDEITVHGYSERPLGKANVRGLYQALLAGLSDIVRVVDEVVENGLLLGCRSAIHGTHSEELAGIAATGRRIQQPGRTILGFTGDRVVERHSVADFATVSPLAAS